jgi:rRNA-processing protein FCF1
VGDARRPRRTPKLNAPLPKPKIKKKKQIDLVRGMVDCLYAECTPCVTDCVMAELEKLGTKYRVALKIAKDPRLERLPCTHKGTYADDCLCDRVRQHRCYIVATCDRDLRRRLRKVRTEFFWFAVGARARDRRGETACSSPRFAPSPPPGDDYQFASEQ